MSRLHSYQHVGALFLEQRFGAILGDCVGAGKTRQAIFAACSVTANRPRANVLVICPKVLKQSPWHDEIVAMLGEPDEEVEVLPNTPQMRYGTVSWVIAHYEQFNDRSRVREWFLERFWDVVIVDEVHNISHPSQRSKGIAKLRCERRWGLTGTPIADRPEDLFGLLRWIDPERFRNKWRWINSYFEVSVNRWGGWEVGRLVDPVAFARCLKPYLLARRADELDYHLPGLLTQNVFLDMEPQQERLYRQLERRMVVELKEEAGQPVQILIPNAIARFTQLHRCASRPLGTSIQGVKADWLRVYLDGGGPPALILSRYNHTVDMIQAIINQSNHPHKDSFTVGTYARYSHGHNLQHLSTVILWDQTFSRLEHEQAIGRVYRQGQRERVMVYELQCNRTVDLHVSRMIARKEGVVEAVLSWLRRYEELSRITQKIQETKNYGQEEYIEVGSLQGSESV